MLLLGGEQLPRGRPKPTTPEGGENFKVLLCEANSSGVVGLGALGLASVSVLLIGGEQITRGRPRLLKVIFWTILAVFRIE